jgi:hypothetical protein
MVAAIIKTIHLAALTAKSDYTFDTLSLTVWVAVEQYLIILAACIPALTPLFNIIVRRVTSRRSRSKSTPQELGASDRKLSRPQPYLPFASVGRDYVEYPMTCVGHSGKNDSKRRSSDSEALITINPDSPKEGILKTTEFHLQGMVRYDGT